MVKKKRLRCLLVLSCPTVHINETEAYFYPTLLILCLPNLSLLFLPIFWLSYPFQCLDCNFCEAKSDFSVFPPCSEWRNIILSCCPLKSLCCAVGTYQLFLSQFLHRKHRIAFHHRSKGKPVPLWWNPTVAKTVILFNGKNLKEYWTAGSLQSVEMQCQCLIPIVSLENLISHF